MDDCKYNEVSDTSMRAPHVVIIGAGASLAAFPSGDRNSKRLPLMNDLITVCGLHTILQQAGIEYDDTNFEALYSELYNRKQDRVLREVEIVVRKYFMSLELPAEPTLYDLLVISLRPKDLIATFNWDPLLWQALKRNHRWAPGPRAVFLHGNAAIGYCINDRVIGPIGSKCVKCLQQYEDSKLLYPILEKDYTTDPYIADSWDALKKYLKHAYILTIFGKSVPESDVEAVRLMKEGWGPLYHKQFAQTEIIDTADSDKLRKTWRQFIHTNHYEIHSSFSESIIAAHPRRSCSAMWAQFMENKIVEEYQIPESTDWHLLREWYSSRIKAEKREGDRE